MSIETTHTSARSAALVPPRGARCTGDTTANGHIHSPWAARTRGLRGCAFWCTRPRGARDAGPGRAVKVCTGRARAADGDRKSTEGGHGREVDDSADLLEVVVRGRVRLCRVCHHPGALRGHVHDGILRTVPTQTAANEPARVCVVSATSGTGKERETDRYCFAVIV